MALRNNSDAICEKPVVLNPWNIDFLAELERETNRRVYTILQLRYHPAVVKLKEKIQREKTDKIHDVVLTYITGRGKWYNYSWKGDEEKSGGLVTNIGVHFFDMLHHIFGRLIAQKLHYRTSNWCAGYLLFKRAQVRWFLSTDTQYLPKEAKTLGKSSYRSILIDDKELDLTDGFTDLHTLSYEHILMGNGFGLSDAKPSIEIVHSIRHSEAVPKIDMSDMHPLVRLAKKK
jgi:UDP-N-acetyl-2-amino-2-deoxyglucuronate dehydrogenase